MTLILNSYSHNLYSCKFVHCNYSRYQQLKQRNFSCCLSLFPLSYVPFLPRSTCPFPLLLPFTFVATLSVVATLLVTFPYPCSLVSFTMSLSTPAISYKSTLDISSLTKQKLKQSMNNAADRERLVPVFDGTGGVETLLYVEEMFRGTWNYLQIDQGPEMFDFWEQCLVGDALTEWHNNTVGIVAAQRTPARFDQEVTQFYLSFCSADARNVMYDYLSALHKPRDASPRAFGIRMKTLVRYAGMLPGTAAAWDNAKMMEVIFNAMPRTWKVTFKRSKDLTTVSLPDLLQFMEDEKTEADRQENNKKKREAEQKKKSDNKPKKQRTQCRYPGHGNHEWKDCIYNPNSPNYCGRSYRDTQQQRQQSRSPGRAPRGRGHSHGNQYRQGGGRSQPNGSYHNAPFRVPSGLPPATFPPQGGPAPYAESHHLEMVGNAGDARGASGNRNVWRFDPMTGERL